MAILAGDALLTDAFALATQCPAPAEVIVELADLLSEVAQVPLIHRAQHSLAARLCVGLKRIGASREHALGLLPRR